MNVKLSPALADALNRAQGVLAQRKMIADAISAAEKELPTSIEQRLAAESELARVEAAAALGEGDAKTLAAARKHLATVRENLDGTSARLRGLKSRGQEQATELIEAHQGIQAGLPAYRQDVAVAFTPEWEAAIDSFSVVLAKRSALETALKIRFDLPEPSPGRCNKPVDVGELGRPGSLLAEAESAISEINQTKRLDLRTSRKTQPFDADRIYKLTRAWGRFKAGDRVLGDSLGADALWLHEHHYLIPVDSSAAA